MKKKILGFTLAIIMLMNFSVLVPISRAATFPDVSDSHWARQYIYRLQGSGIIDGYEDGTFKPEQEVKTGEFIKMACMGFYPNYQYVAPDPEYHWSKPYADALNRTLLKIEDYNNEKVERIITRAEMAKIMCYYYMLTHIEDKELSKLDRTEMYIKNFSDESEIVDEEDRLFLNNCIRFGLINGYEDGTIRAYSGLTRAQASKIISLAKYGN